MKDGKSFSKMSAGLGTETSGVINNLQKDAIKDRINAKLQSKESQIAYI